jgi:FkbM family methyltransferase
MNSTVSASRLDQLQTRYSGRTAEQALGRQESAADRLAVVGSSVGERAVLAAVGWLARKHLLWRFNFTVRGVIDRRSVAIPIINGEGIQLVRGDERWMFELLKMLIGKRPGAFVDIGANLGQTLLKTKTIDADIPYYGFEPNPTAYSYCRELVRANQFRNVMLFPTGLSGRSEVVLLFTKSDTDPSGSIVAGFRPPERYSDVQPVSVHRGDEVIEGLGVNAIGVIKIDVEGGELDVLQGLTRTLSTCRPLVLCEVLPVYDPATPHGQLRRLRQQQLAQLLHDASYRIFRIHAPRAELKSLDDFGLHGDIALSNYLFAPADAPAQDWTRI